MCFVRHGVNIMAICKSIGMMSAVTLTIGLIGCSAQDGDAGKSGESAADYQSDRKEIEATLEETAVRWRYGDKAVLYEQEFEYLLVENTYDDYLGFERIRGMQSDTVEAFAVKDVQFFGRDSALVAVDVVFVGLGGDTTTYPQEWPMYRHRGRWIRPSLSTYQCQIIFEERRRQADSAAAHEEEEDW